MRKIKLIIFFTGAVFALNAHAWFFFFIPGGATRAAADAITGARGNICIKDTYQVGDTITSPSGNTAKVISVSGTSSMCNNPLTPIRAELEFTYSFSSKAGIELSDDYDPVTLTDLERFNGQLLKARSKTIKNKGVLISAIAKTPQTDILNLANNMEKNMSNNLKDATSQNSEQLVINGLNAVRFELLGSSKGIFGQKFVYQITIIEGKDEILSVNAYAHVDDYDKLKQEFLKISENIKGLLGQPDNLSDTTSSATGVGKKQNNIEDKLRKLNQLLKDGLINQKDYDLKKNEVLRSI